MVDAHAPMPAALALSRRVMLLAYYGLILYFAAYATLALDGMRAGTVVIWFIQTLPLWIFAPGLHKLHLRTHAWLCFVVLLYFIHGVLIAFESGRRLLGLIEVGLCVLLFIMLIVFIRQYRRHYNVHL